LAKLEASLALAIAGLAVVPVGVLTLTPDGGSHERGGQERNYSMLLRFAAALLSAAAALVHLAVIKQHADEYWLYGAFFVAVGLGQFVWALVVLAAPIRTVFRLGALGNAAVVVFFIVTRTVGTLVGPEATEPATVGFGDTATTVFEALITALCGGLLLSSARAGRRPVALAGAVSLVTLLVIAPTALALQSTVSSAPFVPQAG
jgi:hypothetical protein